MKYGLVIDLFLAVWCALIRILCLMMVAEWIFAYYIIDIQHGRDVGEITFDHHHENLNSPIQKGQISFRRKEIKYWNCIKCYMCFDTIYTITSNLYPYNIKWLSYLMFVLGITCGLIPLVAYFWLYFKLKSKMKKFHTLEYEKNVKYLKI